MLCVTCQHHLDVKNTYLFTVGMLCCVTLYNSTSDHTCWFQAFMALLWSDLCAAPPTKPRNTLHLQGLSSYLLLCDFFLPLSFHSTLSHSRLAYLCSSSRTPCWIVPWKDRELPTIPALSLHSLPSQPNSSTLVLQISDFFPPLTLSVRSFKCVTVD